MPFSRPSPEMDARCDMETYGGGWVVIQRRVSGGTENFERGWVDYENGFGDLNGEFWYGLRNMHCLTTRDDVELRIELKKDDGTTVNRTYQLFRVAGPDDNYRLHIGLGEGTNSYDFMVYHNNQQFSTHDRDNDSFRQNCANDVRGGGWFNNCYSIHMNGPHVGSGTWDHIRVQTDSSNWVHDGNDIYTNVELKIRPKSCTPQKQCQ